MPNMNREEALKLLRGGPKGIQKWNRRREKGEGIPELSGAVLSDAILRDAALDRVDLSGSDLPGADFCGANLRRADLTGADLTNADFRGANLSLAVLSVARLIGVNLGGADLGGTTLRRTDLRKTNFTNAILNRSILTDLDLSEANGLDQVKFYAPCSISIDTLINSKGKIPESFLRGCGVPDSWIEYLPSLLGSHKPIEIYSCFISYSHKDEDFCRRLYSRMRDEHMRVWYAPEDMKSGRKLHEQITTAIRLHDKLLLVLSEDSMKSEWVATEIYTARQREIKEGKRVLFPIRLVDFERIRDWQCFDADSGKDMAREIREYFIPDFSNWKEHDAFEEAFARLLKDLTAENKTS